MICSRWNIFGFIENSQEEQVEVKHLAELI